MSLFELLLHDKDGDGLYDGLSGKVYLPPRADRNTLRAASEVLARLATRTVRLQPELAELKHLRHGFFMGRRPPRAQVTEADFQVLFSSSGLAFTARSSKKLLQGARWFSQWPYLIKDKDIEVELNTTLERISWHRTEIRLEFRRKLTSSDLDSFPATVSLADGCLTMPLGDISTPQVTKTKKRLFSLGTALQGGGLYTGNPTHPETLGGTLQLHQPIKEAVHVAARLCTEGLTTCLPVTSDEGGVVHLLLDKSLATGCAEIRVVKRDAQAHLEIAGKNKQDLARAATFFASTYPELPDGRYIHEVETSLEDVLQNQTRVGRLASLAVHTRPSNTVRGLLANPLGVSPKLLGLPVRNSARDGKRLTWQATFLWEGKRFLASITAANLGSHQHLHIKAFLSESENTRKALAAQVKAQLESRGVSAEVTIFSAYKPGFHWLLEVIGPRAQQLGATRLEVRCAPHDQGVEVVDRWLRELYPVVEILEARFGFNAEVRLDDQQRVPYLVRVFGSKGKLLFEDTLSPPTLEIPCFGRPDTHAHPTTGWVTINAGSEVLLDEHIPTDRDLVWEWYTTQVMPELIAELDTSAEPLFSDLSINVSLSEPDDYTGLDHEFCSAVEAMHEEFYFGTLEVLSALRGQAFQERLSTPGWILPFCQMQTGQDSNIRVNLTLPGTHRLGWETRSGGFSAVPHSPVKVSAETLELKPAAAPCLHLTVTAPTVRAAKQAAAKLTWLLQQRESNRLDWNITEGTDLELTFKSPRKTVTNLHLEAQTSPRLPVPDLHRDTHLSPREVVNVAQHFKAQHPNVHLRPLKETRLGNPLVCLELGVPPGSSRARLARWKPSVLISARQHANEPTSTPANFLWLQHQLDSPLFRCFNFIFHPLENPDGAKLYSALRQMVSHHMHHAARYTSLGSDIESTPAINGSLIAERQLHEEAKQRWSPLIHLNNHGYPAHEWTRPHSGYVPAHFEDWSLPFGYLAILIAEPKVEPLLYQSQQQIVKRLAATGLVPYTHAQVKRNLRYRSKTDLPFTFAGDLPFLLRARSNQEKIPTFNAGKTWLTLISEVPDESVDGELWHSCVLAHQQMNQAVLESFKKSLNLTSKEHYQNNRSAIFSYEITMNYKP